MHVLRKEEQIYEGSFLTTWLHHEAALTNLTVCHPESQS